MSEIFLSLVQQPLEADNDGASEKGCSAVYYVKTAFSDGPVR